MAREYLRAKDDPLAGRVSYVELFYDLVFVFAITQLSHLLLHHYSWLGALETLVLMLAVWWVWIYTTWALNWLDPQRGVVRGLVYASMLLGLVMSMSVADAFGERGLPFALSFVAMQIGRSLVTAYCIPRDLALRANFYRIAAWFAASGVFWIAGAFLPVEARLVVWTIALAIEYAGPIFRFRTPRLGASETADWDVRGEHIAERCALFVIICLGETLLISGATFADMEWYGPGLAAFLVNFLSTVAMWWLYFHIGQNCGAHAIEHSVDPGRIARAAFTYAHIPIIAGIIVAAVAAELVLAHPLGHVEPGTTLAVLGANGLFLIGNLWFKSLTAGRPPLSHIVGLVLTAGAAFIAAGLSPLGLAAVALAILIVVAIWEFVSLGGGMREATA